MRDISIHLKVSREEKDRIYGYAKKMGVSANEFIVRASLKETELCKPAGKEVDICSGEKVHINLTLDRDVVKLLDDKAKKIGIGRAALIKRMIVEKKVISVNMCLDMNKLFKEMSELMHELLRANRAAIRLIEAGDIGLGSDESKYALKTLDDTNKALAGILKNFWKLNIKVRDTARREVRKYLKENEDNGDC